MLSYECSIPGQSLCCLWFGHCLQLLPVQNKKQHYSPWMAWALSQMLEPKNPKVLFCRKSLKIYRHPMVKTQEMKQTAQRLAGDLIGQQCNSWVSLNRSTRILPDLATSPQRCHHLDMLSKARLKEEPPKTVQRHEKDQGSISSIWQREKSSKTHGFTISRGFLVPVDFPHSESIGVGDSVAQVCHLYPQ